jgi:hypothetical protein
MNMSKVVLELSMSLDGFVAGPNDNPDNGLGDGGDALFKWYSSGDTDFPLPVLTWCSRFHVPAQTFFDPPGRT